MDMRRGKSFPYLKRMVDVAGSLLGILLCAPLMACAAVYIWLRMGSPVMFRQRRTGIHGTLFTLLKFRTLREGEGLPDASRLTPAGALLRSLSIDELPQLWNVLRGEMSLVGPRPLLPEYLPHYNEFQRRRFEIKPGITGWAQVNGRNAISWAEKFRMDVWYVDHATLFLDFVILCKTVGKVLRRKGISEAGHVTATKFCHSASGRGSL
jgi:sugar transferase EpsL